MSGHIVYAVGMTNTTNPTTGTLYFDPRGHSIETDGATNPAWVKAAQPFDITDGDLGPIGKTWIAVHTHNGETGEWLGRDYLGRAVKVIEKGGDDLD